MKRERSRGPEPIDALLAKWLRRNAARAHLDCESIFGRWPEIVGPELAASTRAVDLRGGLLTIEVDSPALLTELATYYRDELLSAVRQVDGFTSIHELRFRAASFGRARKRST